LFVHFLQDLYRRSCRPGAALRACPGSASPFFVLCFLLVKFISLLDMDGLSVVMLTALSTVMRGKREALCQACRISFKVSANIKQIVATHYLHYCFLV
jgi:hypothetical protein